MYMKQLAYFSLLILAVSCGTTASMTRISQYPKMYEAKPLTILVMPPINNTSNVEAKDLLYTSISKPLAEAGYYVISPHLAMDILKEESAYDSELFVETDLNKFKEYFGADAVVFSQIDEWAKKGFGIETKIRYFIKSTSDNEVLFDRSCDLYLDLSQDSGQTSLLGVLVDIAASAITTAATDHIVAARKANAFIFSDMPRGKYDSMHGLDGKMLAQEKKITTRVK